MPQFESQVFDIHINVNGRLESSEEFEDIIFENKSSVDLWFTWKDVARIGIGVNLTTVGILDGWRGSSNFACLSSTGK